MALEPITRAEQIMSGESLEPITREEMFLAKAAGMDVDTPKPITRREMFLSKISGGSGGGSGSNVVGTWVFVDDPDLTTMPKRTDVLFVSNDTTYTEMFLTQQGASSWGIYCIGFDSDVIAYVNNPSGSYGITHGWKNEAYRTITIIASPDDEAFATWLKANATKQEEATVADYQAALAEMGVEA